ncbi:MAG: hypothetical protein GX552_00170 [Chloroflexi bacterium]|nr:hypothetical protein [Chloroflexota bacterium]
MPLTYRQLQERIINRLRLLPGAITQPELPADHDYAQDPAMALTSVVFLPPPLARDIQRAVIAPLQLMEPQHYYYPPEAMHLTIKNVCAPHDPPLYSDADVQRAHQVLAQVTAQHAPFVFTLEQVVALTGSVCLIGYGDEQYRELVLDLRTGLQRLGMPEDARLASAEVFFGNVTLCRYGCAPSDGLLRAITERAYSYRADLRVEVIHLITCNRACAPASRRLLYAYRLGEGSIT